jgi:hypothetical protein
MGLLHTQRNDTVITGEFRDYNICHQASKEHSDKILAGLQTVLLGWASSYYDKGAEEGIEGNW